MKLEHLIQTYKVNKINAELKEMNTEEGKSGIIKYEEGITASYLLDKEDIIVAMKMFFNCLTPDILNVQNQVEHTVKIINIMQNTISLLSSASPKEANLILEGLGMFDNTFKNGKQIKHLEYEYRIEVIDGLLCLSITENNAQVLLS